MLFTLKSLLFGMSSQYNVHFSLSKIFLVHELGGLRIFHSSSELPVSTFATGDAL
jgi:hypothetical protein